MWNRMSGTSAKDLTAIVALPSPLGKVSEGRKGIFQRTKIWWARLRFAHTTAVGLVNQT